MKADLSRIWDGLAQAAADPNFLYHNLVTNGPVCSSKQDAYGDPTPVPAGLLRSLKALAAQRGYPVLRKALPNQTLGHTLAQGNALTGHKIPGEIALDYQLNEAAQCRVLCHELGHTFWPAHQCIDEVCERIEEGSVEGGAALVTAALQCSNGNFSTSFIARQSGGYDYMIAKMKPIAIDLATKILKGTGYEHIA